MRSRSGVKPSQRRRLPRPSASSLLATRTQRLWLLVLLAGLYLGVGVFDHDVWAPTEPAMAGVAWTMYHDGELTVPAINGLPYLEKPPLAYWLSVLSFKAAGRMDAGLLRLPAALAGLAALALLWWTARRLYDESTAWACTFLCALTANFFGIMHRASTDSIATFFFFLGGALFLCATSPRSRRGAAVESTTQQRNLDIALGVVLAISFFVKNFYTFLLLVPPITVFLLAERDYRRLARIAAVTSISLAGLLIAWILQLHHRGGSEYLRIVFFDNTIGRFTNIRPSAGRQLTLLDDAFSVHKHESLLTGLRALAEETMPWPLIYGAAILHAFRAPGPTATRRFLLIGLVSILICLTVSAARVESYYRPIIFLLSLLAGDYLYWLRQEASAAERRTATRIVLGNLWTVAVLVALIPLALGMYTQSALIAWSTLPCLIAVGGFAALVLRSAHATNLITLCSMIAVCFGVTLGLAYRTIDSEKSLRPFFDEIASALSTDSALYTSIVDDRTLPSINFYLDRRLELVPDVTSIPALLNTEQPVAAIVTSDEYAALISRLAGLHVRVIHAPKGTDTLVYIDNGGTAPDLRAEKYDERGVQADPRADPRGDVASMFRAAPQ